MNKRCMRKSIFAVCLAPFVLAAELAAPGENLRRAGTDAAGPDVPSAPAAYRRPAGFVPTLWPQSLKQISDAHSDALITRAAAEMKRVDAVNAKGPWHATPASIDAHRCPEWFLDAKFGIFIDWGLWSLASWCPYRQNERMYPDWYEWRFSFDFKPDSPFFGMREYHAKNWGADFKRDHFISLFKASRFDPEALCRVFKSCGAKYVVPFLKHHSGFCLWDSSYTFRDVVDQGPHRDLSSELVKACRRNALKFGFYFSVGEWEYPLLDKNGNLKKFMENVRVEDFTPDMEFVASGKIAVRNYVREYSIPQAVEFIDKYDPDLLWYDYDWSDYADRLGTYDIASYFYNKNQGVKEVAVNDRYGNGRPAEIAGKFTKKRPRKWLRTVRGDFFTDEAGDTTECIDPAKKHPWECCRGISLAFGNHWQDNEANVMTEKEFICTFADIVARGGNLLLLINLDGQGAIPEIQRKRLLQIGTWLARYGEAIYATRALAPFKTDAVDYTQSKDETCAYAIVKQPASEVRLECALKEGVTVTIVGTDRRLTCRRDGAALVVSIPPEWSSSSLPFALKCAYR